MQPPSACIVKILSQKAASGQCHWRPLKSISVQCHAGKTGFMMLPLTASVQLLVLRCTPLYSLPRRHRTTCPLQYSGMCLGTSRSTSCHSLVNQATKITCYFSRYHSVNLFCIIIFIEKEIIVLAQNSHALYTNIWFIIILQPLSFMGKIYFVLYFVKIR